MLHKQNRVNEVQSLNQMMHCYNFSRFVGIKIWKLGEIENNY